MTRYILDSRSWRYTYLLSLEREYLDLDADPRPGVECGAMEAADLVTKGDEDIPTGSIIVWNDVNPTAGRRVYLHDTGNNACIEGDLP